MGASDEYTKLTSEINVLKTELDECEKAIKYHSFPTWPYTDQNIRAKISCLNCKGTGKKSGAECNACGGTRSGISKDLTEGNLYNPKHIKVHLSRLIQQRREQRKSLPSPQPIQQQHGQTPQLNAGDSQHHSGGSQHLPGIFDNPGKAMTLDTMGLKEVVGYTPKLKPVFQTGLDKAVKHVNKMLTSSKRPLTDIEAAAINLYAQEKTQVYKHLNTNLRKYHGRDARYDKSFGFLKPRIAVLAGNYQPYLELLIGACEKLPPKSDTTLYRGLNAQKAWVSKFQVGNIVPLVAVQSYSEKGKVAKRFAGRGKNPLCVLFMLSTKETGSRAFDIDKFSPFGKNEDETIVMPGTKVKVVSRRSYCTECLGMIIKKKLPRRNCGACRTSKYVCINLQEVSSDQKTTVVSAAGNGFIQPQPKRSTPVLPVAAPKANQNIVRKAPPVTDDESITPVKPLHKGISPTESKPNTDNVSHPPEATTGSWLEWGK